MNRFKKILAVFAIVPVLFHISASNARSLDEIKESKKLIVVTSAANPPGGFIDPSTNSLKGVMVDLAEAIGAHIGVSVEFMNVPFSGLIASLRSGRADMISAPLFMTEERAKAVAFSDPIYGWGEGIIVSEKAKGGYETLNDLKGKRVATLVDSVQYRMINELPSVEIKTYPDYTTLLADVRAGRVDLGVVDPPSIIYQIQSKSISGTKLDDSYTPVKTWWVGIAVQLENQSLLASINAAIAKMKENGELEKILKTWGVEKYQAK